MLNCHQVYVSVPIGKFHTDLQYAFRIIKVQFQSLFMIFVWNKEKFQRLLQTSTESYTRTLKHNIQKLVLVFYHKKTSHCHTVDFPNSIYLLN